jgi:hypothetical protein
MTADFYKIILDAVKGRDLLFTDPQETPGILLRHDVDDLLDHSVKMAEMENKSGVRSTYFILNTAPYWDYDSQEFFYTLRYIQSLGHDIGWHNNCLTELLTTGLPLDEIISKPLDAMRENGLVVRGMASHGDAMCYGNPKYVNYMAFGFTKLGWEGFDHPVYDMYDFDLEYDAIMGRRDDMLSDSGGKWSKEPVATLKEWEDKTKRYQLLIHPQWWTL